ncbi:low molecular weight protein-tyrosine-phosphatase [Lactimicrobium massiliense]|jgi:protein-tyrosine phosphatase|uniref:low molecular weight protein-tyrosine-phosphatase n=1 Tax=Lactimicrobium massiliense TaxID=2161814 RepID=UPI000D55A800|nr:low molecular weight protein-tyrosine-phosphatase [Lactimicrobium massiliense]
MIRILFVCHGNICRSVGAQYIMQDLVNRAGCSDDFYIDSAATSTEETGNPIYPPMKAALQKNGIPIGSHRARQLKREDYEKYDLLIGMDEENIFLMKQILKEDPAHKIHYLMEYTDSPDQKIDDPWYTRQFQKCTDKLENGCKGLFAWTKKTLHTEKF